MNQNINKEFEDHSWDAMRALLDREMPEGGLLIPPVSTNTTFSNEGKKRRWLWLFLIATTSIAGSFAWYYFSKTIPTPIAKTMISEEGNTVKKDENVIARNVAIEGGGNIISEKNKPVLYKTKELQNIDNQLFKSDIQQINKPNITLENTEKSKDNIRQTNNLPYTFLPLLKAFIIETPDINLKINTVQTITQIIKPSKVNKTTWGITTGAHTEGGKTLEGFQAGLVFGKAIGQKWAIQTGLNYRRNTAQGDSLTFIQLDKATGLSSSPTASTFNLAQGKELKLKNLNYLELPLTVHYTFHRKISAFTGLKAAYLLSNSVSTSDNSKLYVVNSTTADKNANSKSSNFVQGNSVTSLGLKRWDGAVIGGIFYTVSPKTVVSLRYDFGFNNILNKQNWKAYNRYLGLNLNYTF